MIATTIINTRRLNVLKFLVERYVATAEPVPSGVIVKKIQPTVSPATVRNYMATLEESGYITRPHISAGGVPSSKGYRLYVDTMGSADELPDSTKEGIRQKFKGTSNDVMTCIQLATTILSNMTGNMAVVTYPQTPQSRVRRLEIVYLKDFLALVVVVLQGARLVQQLVTLKEKVNQDKLTKVANKLNDIFAGNSLEEINNHRLELSGVEEDIKQNALTALKERDADSSIEHNVDGMRHLLEQPEFSETDKAKKLVELVEEEVFVRQISSELGMHGRVAVVIGEENSEKTLRDYSMINCQYGHDAEYSGTVSVIGPTRMGYNSSVSAATFLSSVVDELVSTHYEVS